MAAVSSCPAQGGLTCMATQPEDIQPPVTISDDETFAQAFVMRIHQTFHTFQISNQSLQPTEIEALP